MKLTWHYKLGSWIGYDHIIDSSILAIVRRRWIFRDWIACARVIPHYQKRFLKKRFDGDEEAKAWCESEIDRIANMNREWRSGQKNQNGLHTHRKDAAGLEISISYCNSEACFSLYQSARLVAFFTAGGFSLRSAFGGWGPAGGWATGQVLRSRSGTT